MKKLIFKGQTVTVTEAEVQQESCVIYTQERGAVAICGITHPETFAEIVGFVNGGEIVEKEPPPAPEPTEEQLLAAMERKILREQAQERLAGITAKEKKELLK